jgi:hypothetical protein
MTSEQQQIHEWFHRLLTRAYGDMDWVWQIINYEMECQDSDRDSLRAAFHNFNSQFSPE